MDALAEFVGTSARAPEISSARMIFVYTFYSSQLNSQGLHAILLCQIYLVR